MGKILASNRPPITKDDLSCSMSTYGSSRFSSAEDDQEVDPWELTDQQAILIPVSQCSYVALSCNVVCCSQYPMHWCGVRFLGLLSSTKIALSLSLEEEEEEEEEEEAFFYSIFEGTTLKPIILSQSCSFLSCRSKDGITS